MSRLAYLGPPGTYSEEAALAYDSEAELIAFPTESSVASAVESHAADEGVLAIENSLEGSVTRSLDALIHESTASIRCEIVLKIEHCLVARPDTALSDVREVHAHPQALAQCRKFIEERIPGAVQQGALSNAAAVQEVVVRSDAAAIAPARAAELYGAVVLVSSIQDSPHNKTRFVVIGPGDVEATEHDKTSIAFTVAHDQPGTLVGVLHEFSDRAINLTRIESRPSREELGVYIFLVDMEGHRTHPSVADALAAVQDRAQFFRVLGSYPDRPMPEIPDLEAIRGFLNERIRGVLIERAEFIIPVVFRVPKDAFAATLEGDSFTDVTRYGKFLLFSLESGHVLVINAMLTGRFQYVAPDTKRRAKTCMALGLADGRELRYTDDRLMGKIYLVPIDEIATVPQFAEMGPDALEVGEEEFTQRIRRFTGQIKGVLVNHKFIAGIGNAYSDEILFTAKLHPYRKRTKLSPEDISRLHSAIGKVFTRATPIVAGQMKEELNYEERRDFLKVHRRGGEPCPICGTRISEITAGQRITSFCRNCQPG